MISLQDWRGPNYPQAGLRQKDPNSSCGMAFGL